MTGAPVVFISNTSRLVWASAHAQKISCDHTHSAYDVITYLTFSVLPATHKNNVLKPALFRRSDNWRMAGYQRREDDTAVDVKTIRLLTTLYTNSLWMEVLEMESVTLKLATQYSVQKPALAVLICTILGETHLVTNGFAKVIVLDERGLKLYEGNGDIRPFQSMDEQSQQSE